jgi:lysozyme
MNETINPMVVDLSHYDNVTSWKDLKAAGIVGVIYKATQGSGYQDPTYADARKQALKAGLLWGAYHFGDDSDVDQQVANFLGYAEIDEESLFCLDYEEYQNSTMNYSDSKQFMQLVEAGLGRDGEGVLYSGNHIKETIPSNGCAFWNPRRLWLAQYGYSPVLPPGYENYWLWQFTGDGQGPEPHCVAGIEGDVDINSYAGTEEQLCAEWASGVVPGPMPEPVIATVTITIDAPSNVKVEVVNASAVVSKAGKKRKVIR